MEWNPRSNQWYPWFSWWNLESKCGNGIQWLESGIQCNLEFINSDQEDWNPNEFNYWSLESKKWKLESKSCKPESNRCTWNSRLNGILIQWLESKKSNLSTLVESGIQAVGNWNPNEFLESKKTWNPDWMESVIPRLESWMQCTVFWNPKEIRNPVSGVESKWWIEIQDPKSRLWIQNNCTV